MLWWITASLCAFFIKGLFGFANTLVFTTILSFHTANVNISPVELILGYPSNIILAWKERRSIQWNICLPLEERYRLDVYYVDHFSLSLDIRILLRTVGVVLLGEGRYAGRPLVHTGEGAGQSGARHPGP